MKNTYIKLFIGVLLFATWIALVVCKVPDSGDIIGCIKLALAGLGVYHMADTNGSPAAPTDKQGGFGSVGLLLAVALSSILMLTGCANTEPTSGPAAAASPQRTQVTYVQACTAWGAGFETALELRKAGKLNQAQIDKVTLLDSQVTPICTGPLPADAATATQQVTAGVTALAILEAVNKEK